METQGCVGLDVSADQSSVCHLQNCKYRTWYKVTFCKYFILISVKVLTSLPIYSIDALDVL